jgi:hypothetical protein
MTSESGQRPLLVAGEFRLFGDGGYKTGLVVDVHIGRLRVYGALGTLGLMTRGGSSSSTCRVQLPAKEKGIQIWRQQSVAEKGERERKRHRLHS